MRIEQTYASAGNLAGPGQIARPTPELFESAETHVDTFQIVEDVFNLSKNSRDIPGDLKGLSPEQRQQLLKMIADLLKMGVIGKETFEVRGEERERFVTVGIGEQRDPDARPPRDRGGMLDLRA